MRLPATMVSTPWGMFCSIVWMSLVFCASCLVRSATRISRFMFWSATMAIMRRLLRMKNTSTPMKHRFIVPSARLRYRLDCIADLVLATDSEKSS